MREDDELAELDKEMDEWLGGLEVDVDHLYGKDGGPKRGFRDWANGIDTTFDDEP